MNNNVDMERRAFLKTGSALGGGMVLGFSLFGCGPKHDAKTTIRNVLLEKGKDDSVFIPNMWLRIDKDNRITIQSACSEMGQGVMTAIPMLVAEELEAEMSMIDVEFAPAHKDFENPESGFQATGGSNSIRGFWIPLRQAGATAREMLITAAAQQWSVEKIECHAKNGNVVHIPTNKALAYGELTAAASLLEIPEDVPLKKPDRFKLIGKPQGRLDTPIKTNGSAVFGIDVQLSGLLTACVARCPVFKGKLKNLDSSKAIAVAGVRHVVTIDSGVAVIADHFWAAKQGRDALIIEWDEGELASQSDTNVSQLFIDALKDTKSIRDDGNAQQILGENKRKISATFETPFLAHACMEPMNCTAHVSANRCDIWAPTQSQEFCQNVGKEITGLPAENVWVHTTFLGGGFGRRAEKDFVIEAVQCSQAVNTPVKVVWTREDDIQHDYYRPATYNELHGSIDQQGNAIAWQHDIASPSILKRFVPFASLLLRGKDATSTEGADNLPYAIPNIAVNYAAVDTGIPVGFWRSVSNSQNGFITECFIDELAGLAEQDPLKYRIKLLQNSPRHLQALQVAADKFNWNKPLTQGHYKGIAVVGSFDSYVAQAVEISIEPNATPPIKVHRIVCAIDCGIVVNPDTVLAQVEGGIVFGLSAVHYGEINIDKGRVLQSNFHDYPCLRINECPPIETHIISSEENPGGIGETAVPPIAPAVANAVFAATGKRVRKLPIKLNELVFS